jgi:hypothetical protein
MSSKGIISALFFKLFQFWAKFIIRSNYEGANDIVYLASNMDDQYLSKMNGEYLLSTFPSTQNALANDSKLTERLWKYSVECLDNVDSNFSHLLSTLQDRK